MKEDKYNPEIGDIWWFETIKKHCLILTKEIPPDTHRTYRWKYRFLQLETGRYDSILHGMMNVHGEGWFRKIA